VVVPTHNRPATLDRCLEALLAQTLEPAEYEIIVVDDTASPETGRQIERWAKRAKERGVSIRYLSLPGGGPAAARNRGWQAANGLVIAFTDDDCIPEPDWLRRGLSAFTNGVAGVSGGILVPIDGVPTDYARNAAHLESSEFVTANCFYRRETIASTGGFDERFRTAWREDTDLYFTLLARNARLKREPAARVVHPVRPSSWGVSLSQQQKSMYNALLFKKHPELYRARVQASPPWRYYAILGAALLATAAALRGAYRLSALSALLWSALTTRFCLQRLRGTSRAPAHVLEMIVTSILIPPLAVYWRLRGAVRFRVLFL
jgi:glycosyltransferase involved in cell wall biosynthesis